MRQYAYQYDDELRVLENPYYREISRSKIVKGTQDMAKNLMKPVKDFEQKMEEHLINFDDEMDTQEAEIEEQIKHLEFFLREKTKHLEWGANREFDMLRLRYVAELDNLKKEKRGIRKDKILKRIQLEEKLADLRKELSPFRNHF